jgi:hypothetical protein
MQGVFYSVKSEATLAIAEKALQDSFKEHLYVEMQLVSGKPRSVKQNNLIYKLYAQAARLAEGETPLTIRRYCKLTLGVPLLRSEDEAYRKVWDSYIKPCLTYEQKLGLMDFFPVSSHMSTAQETRYIDSIIIEYNLELR